MKIKNIFILGTIMAALVGVWPSTARAQYTFTFVIPPGGTNGTGVLYLNSSNLVLTSMSTSDGVASYSDTNDILTFNGQTFKALDFTVYNADVILFGNSGFQLEAYAPGVNLELDDKSMDPSAANGLTVSSLITELSTMPDGTYLYSEAPNPQRIGLFNSLHLVSGPSPSISHISMKGGQFSFSINSGTGSNVVVEACTNINSPVWVPIGTNSLSNGSTSFTDTTCTNIPGRYYRIVSQ